ncbi:MAG: GIY-YIG nuclease family protein [Bacilli bacterium]|nr:GIY-YIG nuclease family protein [Bacilli bacterium]
MNEGVAYIYIMTNKSFEGHNWVKIGYATNPEQRRKELSNTSLPFDYEIYATYQVPKTPHMADKTLHNLITSLNPDLRLSSNREFFEMTPEQAYQILLGIARITNTEDKLAKYKVEAPVAAKKSDAPFSREKIASKLIDYLRERNDIIMLTQGNVYERWTTPVMRNKVGLIGSGTWSGIKDLLAYEIKVLDRTKIHLSIYIGPGKKEDREAWLEFALNHKPPFRIKGITTNGQWKRIYYYELCDVKDYTDESKVVEDTISRLDSWFKNEEPLLEEVFK